MTDKARDKKASHHDILVIGGSAGGLQSLIQLVSGLPRELPAAIFVTLHMAPQSKGIVADSLNKVETIPAKQVENGELFRRGRIYVAVPDHHLIVESTRVYAIKGPKENHSRPAIDPLFRSAASAHGSRVIGLILSGMLDDGSAGLAAVKHCGGIAIVQDPADAAYSDMPRNAMESIDVDCCVSLEHMADAVVQSVSIRADDQNAQRAASEELAGEVRIARQGMSRPSDTTSLGELTAFSCPECGGPLWQINDSNVDRFRCYTGHAFTAQTLAADLSQATEQALWVALRTMEDRTRMLERLSRQQERHGKKFLTKHFATLAAESRMHLEQLRVFMRTHWEN